MQYTPKLAPPIFWGLTLLLTHHISSLPTVPSNLQGNLIQNLDKYYLQPPALEETIHEVQRILNQDPSLPRLTRGEIEELYEKVTREEYEKSVKAGDKVRADSMRALMLVLPFNTDNNTEENLQELFTRPPVTKVVDTYSSHQPIQFLTPSMNSDGKLNTNIVGQMDATTYKPSFSLKTKTMPLNPTTYHPHNPPSLLYWMPTTANEPSFVPFKPLMADLPQSFDYNVKPAQRFSSHYSAKNAEFLRLGAEKKKQYAVTSTIKPVADVLQSLGIVANTQTRSRIGLDDYYAAESAPKPSIVSVADLKGVRGQSLGPQIKPDAYSMFKPLNIGEEIRIKPEVEGYLTRFGIVGGRKRKAIKKNEASTQNSIEPLSQESEIATAKLPSNHIKVKKDAPSLGNTELEKLLENLKELERLNVNPQVIATAPKTTTNRPTIFSTSTTTPTPTTFAPSLITNGDPMLVQPKKPRRRIDPNIDIHFANQGNHQTEAKQTDELSKLLENLQELEKLKISPEKALKPTSATNQGTNPAASRNIAVETQAPVQTSALTNRFATSQSLTPQQQLLLFQQQAQSGNTAPDLDQLQKVLQQLQVYEKNNAKTSSTTTTTNRPINQKSQIGPTDFFQLRKLLTDDSELEKLFEQAKAKQAVKSRPIASTIATTSIAKSTTKTPTTSIAELLQLQKYFAQLEKATSRATTTARTITSTTTSTTTTTPKPLLVTHFFANEYNEEPKKITANGELQSLIDRVQQLERLNLQQKDLEHPHPTPDSLTPILGFTTRNVKASQRQEDYRLPVNDFANLRTLYRQVEGAEQLAQGEIEISTKATAVKAYQDQQLETATRKAQNFAQRIIDITNDTGSGSSLQEVDPNDFIHLQKLLSKVQELERVRINVPTANPRQNIHQQATKAPNLDMAASQRTQNIHQPNGAYLVYPTKVNRYEEKNDGFDNLKLDLPVFKKTTEKSVIKEFETTDFHSSEELKDLVYAQTSPERESYANLQPPMIYKTVTKEPPRFVATKSPKDINKHTTKSNPNLEEIQKLLNNAQELKKLGVSLPKELTQQLENKFSQTDNNYMGFKKLHAKDANKTYQKEPTSMNEYLQRFALSDNASIPSQTEKNFVFAPTTASSEEEELSERTAVFSLTTAKSLTPRPSKTTTESSVELPVFSATKIIEAAIKRAVNRIGVSTEEPKGFRQRIDTNVEEPIEDTMLGVYSDSDLITDFSEFNYQIAALDDKPMPASHDNHMHVSSINDLQADSSEMSYQVALLETKDQQQSVTDLTANVDELQRLIRNLQELKSLNLSPSDKALLRQADLQYLENLKKQQTAADDTIKTRRQSDKPTEGSISKAESTTETVSTSTESSRIQLDLSLDDGDGKNLNDNSNTASTKESSTTKTTEEQRNGSLSDLEDSFGPNPITESAPPPKKKNGFYFLADWNSFLEVGDGDDQVVVRLSPKIGDPRLFLPVKIP